MLFSAVPGYVTGGIRAGVKFGVHEIMIDAENLNDENYRGISWGIDAPGPRHLGEVRRAVLAAFKTEHRWRFGTTVA